MLEKYFGGRGNSCLIKPISFVCLYSTAFSTSVEYGATFVEKQAPKQVAQKHTSELAFVNYVASSNVFM